MQDFLDGVLRSIRPEDWTGMKTTRKRNSADFKAKVAMEAIALAPAKISDADANTNVGISLAVMVRLQAGPLLPPDAVRRVEEVVLRQPWPGAARP